MPDLRKIRFGWWGWWVRRYVHQLQPDILHAHQIPGEGWLGAMASYHPFIVTAWGSDVLLESGRSRFRRMLVQYVLKRCDMLTVPSQVMYDVAQNLVCTPEKLHLIPWGVETDIFKPEPQDRLTTRMQLGISLEAIVILSPRSVTPLYNQDIVLDAFANILGIYPNAQLIFVLYKVDRPYLSKLEAQVDSKGITANVRWLSARQEPAHMAQLYRMADVVVSIPASEGYGFSVYEAIATGCPTIISDLPVFQNELKDGVHTLKVPVRDASATANTLLRLLDDPPFAKEISQQGISLAQHNSTHSRVQQTKELYSDMIKRYPHRKIVAKSK